MPSFSPTSCSASLSSSFPLTRAILQQDWSRALRLATVSPHSCQQWTHHDGFFDGTLASRVLPLHFFLVHSCTRSASNDNELPRQGLQDQLEAYPKAKTTNEEEPPLQVLQALLEAYPEALMQPETAYERLPIHCACRKPQNQAPSVIPELVRTCPKACSVPDALRRVPLHYALSNAASVETIQVLLQACPEAAQSVDIRGFCPLHVACAAGASLETIQLVWQAYPEAASVRSKSGFSVAQCLAAGHPQRTQVLQLLSSSQATKKNSDDKNKAEEQDETENSEGSEMGPILNNLSYNEHRSPSSSPLWRRPESPRRSKSPRRSMSPRRKSRGQQQQQHRRSRWGSWNRENFSTSLRGWSTAHDETPTKTSNDMATTPTTLKNPNLVLV